MVDVAADRKLFTALMKHHDLFDFEATASHLNRCKQAHVALKLIAKHHGIEGLAEIIDVDGTPYCARLRDIFERMSQIIPAEVIAAKLELLL